MAALSVSFTLGKASVPNSANVGHNNREFVAGNVDVNRIADNITYAKQDVREAYSELFDDAIKEYNANQKRNDRKINDYYEQISNGNREEAFYEIIVQFGDSKNSSVGSPNGELAKKMLDEYMKSFKERNPNLHVFNSVLHMDEASPHLHINIIPFYTAERERGLKKGVSMRAALDEQGFTAKNSKQNRLVAWEDSELKHMESILKNHGLKRNTKGATYAHMTVEEYKESEDEKKITPTLESSRRWKVDDNAERLQQENDLLKLEKEKLERQKHSPYKSFYYSSPDKQSFVQTKLDELEIPYRETDNGFEAQETFIEEIRRIEKQFKAKENPHRAELLNKLDSIIMQSRDFEDVLSRLRKSGYTIKQGKYIAAKPKYGNQFIRFKSLGENYSEQSIKNRLAEKQKHESEINDRIKSADSKTNAFELMIYKTIQHYTIVFKHDVLPVRKMNPKKPFTWKNDATIDSLVALGKKVRTGTTLESLKQEFANRESVITEKEERISFLKKEIGIYSDLLNKGVVAFEKNNATPAEKEKAILELSEHNINANNYHRLNELIQADEIEIAGIEESLTAHHAKIKEVSRLISTMEKIESETYVQSLITEEKKHRNSEFTSGHRKA